VIAPARVGLKIEQDRAVAVITRTLTETKRALVGVPSQQVDAGRTRATFGSIIVVRRSSHPLYLSSGTKLSRVFRVGTGRRRQRTPSAAS